MDAPSDAGTIERSPEGSPRLAWHHARPEEIVSYWKTDLVLGLDEAEAGRRMEQVGRNQLPEEPPAPLWRRFFAQLWDFTVLALLGAAAVAAALAIFAPEPGASLVARFGDSVAILAIVLLNALLGLVQERRAERALDALRQMAAPTARVIRSGRPQELSAPELVPGDLVLLEDGDRVAADLRLVESHELDLEEAALTGESVPVTKDAAAVLETETPLAERTTMAFMGTRVARGRGRGIVANTGLHTELGAIAGMLARVPHEETPLERDLDRFGRRVVIGCISISALVFATGLALGRQSPRELFLVAVALAVAAIPEGLPAVTTIVLALGTQRMARRHALVRRLPAVETLGCAQVICTDKTGTLTQNAMVARRLWVAGARFTIEGEARRTQGQVRPEGPDAPEPSWHLCMEIAASAHGAHLSIRDSGEIEIQGDPTDAALQLLARRAGVTPSARRLADQPFTSARRMASVLVEDEGEVRALVRGAPEAVIARATHLHAGERRPLSDADRAELLAEATAWAARSMRVIALAYRSELSASAPPSSEWEEELTLAGLVGIVDPPRPEVAAAVAEARQAGIRTMMITGDHPATARAIAEEIGLWEQDALLLTGAELDRMEDQGLEAKIDHLCVVARATAEHKLRVVRALKARGRICAMTGDGVNDAPAVKAASIGVAMGKAGTEVTKEAASLVLADDNYATIVAAVEEGRTIYANIRRFIFFLLSSNAGAVLFVLASSLFGWETPLAPIQILWINLITNGLPALALGVEGRAPDQMNRPPRDPGGAILSHREYLEIVGIGAVMAITALFAFQHFLVDPHHARSPEELAHGRAVVFAILSVGPLAHSFNCRSERRSLFAIGVFSNPSLWGAVTVGLLLQAVVLYTPSLRPLFKTAPLDAQDLAWVFGLALVPFVVGELVKLLRPLPAKPSPPAPS